MNKRVQRVENAACLGGISHPCNEKVRLYERFANDYLTVTEQEAESRKAERGIIKCYNTDK